MSSLETVRDQYERLPYPSRSPADEDKRLVRTWLDALPMINHYCFQGREQFDASFRLLVAGGGTGDATLFLAEQLRSTGCEIVHLDLSAASIQIAQQRAIKRGLNNIRWYRHSLLSVSDLNLGKFDYVNCIGVLHHLDDPDRGLRAPLEVLKPTGAMGVRVYGRIGRTGVYQMQEMLRAINDHNEDFSTWVQRARDVIASAPRTNWYKRAQEFFADQNAGDCEIFDLLLHSVDRGYTVRELYEWLVDGHSLHLQLTDNGRGAGAYLPDCIAGPKELEYLSKIRKLSARRQMETGEVLSGSIKRHSFYLTLRADAQAPYGNTDYVSFFCNDSFAGKDVGVMIEQEKLKGVPVLINHKATGL